MRSPGGTFYGMLFTRVARHPTKYHNLYEHGLRYELEKDANKSKDANAPPAHPRVAALSKDYRLVGVQRILFHSLASMALPAATIQGVMKCTSWMMKDVKNVRPYIFDKPVAKALDWAFARAL